MKTITPFHLAIAQTTADHALEPLEIGDPQAEVIDIDVDLPVEVKATNADVETALLPGIVVEIVTEIEGEKKTMMEKALLL